MCFSHIDADGNAVMVDVTEKAATHRRAVAAGSIRMNEEAFAAVRDKTARKGDVLGVAQVAGIMATKETSRLIPLCHGLGLTASGLKFFLHPESSEIEAVCTVQCDGKTGVEMEALTAVSTAALTVYDMCKAVQKDMVITDIRLVRKTGGVHGDYSREET